MKRGDFTPQPGDLFAWYYDDNIKCHPEETIWSTHMKRLVPCAGTNLLIALTDTDIWWLNSNCFIHARVDDIHWGRWGARRHNRFIHARVDDIRRQQVWHRRGICFNHARMDETIES